MPFASSFRRGSALTRGFAFLQYSSLSGLVNMFRMANGIPASQNRVL